MEKSRRDFLKTAAASATFAAAPLGLSVTTTAIPNLQQGSEAAKITSLFAQLPGQVAYKIFAPAASGGPGFTTSFNSSKMLFVASSIKGYLLCEALRQADAPDIDDVLEKKRLALNASVWSPGSPAFIPEALSGAVSERTTMEAMITRSDNTATDMLFKLAGADNVRSFVSSIGLTNTFIPDSTRAVVAYVFGAPNYLTISWEELQKYLDRQPVHPFLNGVETLASSADDFVSFYSRALQGHFFTHPETLTEFRRILTLCDFIYLIPVPLGVSAYAKSGNADFPNFHVRSFAGGMFVGGRWAYFSFIINWGAPADEDPQTVKAFFAAINLSLSLAKEIFTRC